MDKVQTTYLYDSKYNILYKNEGANDFVYKRGIRKWVPYEHGDSYDEIEDDMRIFVYHIDAQVISEDEAKQIIKGRRRKGTCD